jgi:hypothetical protein
MAKINFQNCAALYVETQLSISRQDTAAAFSSPIERAVRQQYRDKLIEQNAIRLLALTGRMPEDEALDKLKANKQECDKLAALIWPR